MAEIEYLRECGVNYLRCTVQEKTDYRMEMLLQNQPPGFLPAERRRIDEEEWIYCRINGLLSLYHRLEKEKLGEEGLRRVLESIERICSSMEEYLLPFDGLLMDPEYIYVKPDGWEQCCWMYKSGDTQEETAESFLEYLLDHLDYTDQKAVKLLYALYQTCRNAGGGAETIREAWRREQSCREREPEGIREKETAVKKPMMMQPEKKKLQFCLKDILYRFRKIFRSKLLSGWKQLRTKYEGTEKRKMDTVSQGGRNEEAAGTMLLTGGMIQGGIYCLRAKSMEYQDILLLSYPFFVGKDESRMDGVVEDAFVSRYHARIDREGENFRVMDLGSTNGTFLNRERLIPYEARELREGDILIFAHREYEFCYLR